MTQERLEEILEKQKKWLNNEDGGVRAELNGADLRSADLRSANLRSADLIGADFSYAYLSNANLRGADLRSANLRGADLIGADLSYADLRGANLIGADLIGADLRDADLRDATGNNKEIKTLQLGKYFVNVIAGIQVHISCQCHTVEQWEKFTDKEIEVMDDGALEWWKEWKEVILKVAKENK